MRFKFEDFEQATELKELNDRLETLTEKQQASVVKRYKKRPIESIESFIDDVNESIDELEDDEDE